MTKQLDELLRATLARQADAVGAPGFTGESVVELGRARVRRRRASLAVVAAVVAVVVVATWTVNGQRRVQPPPIGPSPTATTAPAPTPTAVTAAAAGVTVRSGATIVAPDGRRTALNVPGGGPLGPVTRAFGGWV